MGLAEDLIVTVDKILGTYAPTTATVYKRTISRVGGYQLISRSVAVTQVDVLLDPQPVFKSIGTPQETISGASVSLAGDYLFVLSVNAMSESELTNKNIVLVLQEDDGSQEVLRLVDYQNPGVNNVDVAYIATYRSIDRP